MKRKRLMLALIVNTAVIAAAALALWPATASASGKKLCAQDVRCEQGWECVVAPDHYCCGADFPVYCQY
jgi:hypothetical protein